VRFEKQKKAEKSIEQMDGAMFNGRKIQVRIYDE